MSAFFVTPTISEVKYRRGEIIKNNPVNINRCNELVKFQYAWYPDNIGIPAIKFVGIDAIWVYNKERDRDADYDELLTNYWINQ